MNVEPTEIEIDGDAGSSIVGPSVITPSWNSWDRSVTSGGDWLTIASDDGTTVYFNVTENTTGSNRKGTIRITSDYAESVDVEITQKKQPVIYVRYAGISGGDLTITDETANVLSGGNTVQFGFKFELSSGIKETTADVKYGDTDGEENTEALVPGTSTALTVTTDGSETSVLGETESDFTTLPIYILLQF